MLTDRVCADLEFRIAKGIRKYGAFADNAHTLGALHLEVAEVHEAIQQRKDWKVREELLDVATVAIRRVLELDARKVTA